MSHTELMLNECRYWIRTFKKDGNPVRDRLTWTNNSFFHSFIKYMCTVTAVHKSLCWVLSRHWTTRASVCSPGEGRSIRRQGKPMHWAQSTKSISPPGNCWGLLELNTWSMEERVTWEVTEGYGSISLLYLILRNWIVCVCVCVCVCVRLQSVIFICCSYRKLRHSC